MTERGGASDAFHAPVMLEEVLAWLGVEPGRCYVDATVGGGGHAEAILERSAPDGQLIGIDRDPEALSAAGERLARMGDRCRLLRGRFGDLAELLDVAGVDAVDGIVADFGVSSFQLNAGRRGFSFRQDAPLDMRMDPSAGENARELLARLSEEAIADLIFEFGEERHARRIARAIRAAMPIETTGALAAVVERTMLARRSGRIHPATRTFQALRIAVNDELGEIDRFLAAAPDRLRPRGRMVVISYHSLEDRRAKRAFAARARDGFRLPRRKVVTPSEAEAARNPRVRSAKLRVLERLAEEGAS